MSDRAGYLPEFKYMNVAPALQAYRAGVDDYRGDQKYAQEQEQRNLLKQVGQTAATQGLNAAGLQAMQGGDIATGIKLQDLSLDRQSKLYEFMGRGAAAADTPEKWQAFVGTLSKTFGPETVRGFEDFKARDSAIMLAMNAKEQADLKLRQQAQGLTERQVAVAERAETKRDAPKDITIYDEKGQEQKALLYPDGSTKPIGGAKKDKPRQMSVNDITKLQEEGAKFSNLTTFTQNFKPEYAGMMGGAKGGDTANWISRNLPSEIQGQVAIDRAEWWQNYNRFGNMVRNELFGASLQPNEQAAFLQADIHPGMNADLIRKNIETQRRIAEAGIKRKAAAMINEGYNEETIAKAYGIKPEDLKGGKTEPAKTNLPQGVTAEKAISDAKIAISQGKDKAFIVNRLKEWGVDTSGL